MAYTIQEHRHRFGVWAASRAAQRNLRGGNVVALEAALANSSLPEIVIGTQSNWPSTSTDFDECHRRWCKAIQLKFLEITGTELSYGRAAKLVAVYLKATVVNAGFEDTSFASVIHPPIDEFLLRRLASGPSVDPAYRKVWKSNPWTKLNEADYFTLIDSIRSAGLAGSAFWKLEQYWEPWR